MRNIEINQKLENLKSKGLVDSAVKNIQIWLEHGEYAQFEDEIKRLVEKEDVSELNDAFYKVIPFGTGGRRGKMGAGTNRINERTIAESAQGFSTYLIKTYGQGEVAQRGIVITYDVRHKSRVFAEIACSVFAGNGIPVYFYDGIRSTPQLSFTIRHKKTIGGAMISASHNPPSDNGIKVYWQHGGQVVPPHDVNIIDEVNHVQEIKQIAFSDAVKSGIIRILGDETDQAYARTVGALSLGNFRDVHVVFTPLHGCATTSFLPVLRNVGFQHIDEVKEQMTFDPDFSHVTKQIPNPEVPISLDMATVQAQKSKADLVLAADPDADRIGVVSRERFDSDNYIFLNGNQIGVLLFDYITKQFKSKNLLDARHVMIETVVTTDLLSRIAQSVGIQVINDLPVGFKYIGDTIEHLHDDVFLFGAEESHGYLFGDYAREKDGAVGALLICEYAAKLKKEGRTLYEQLEYIKKEYGYYRELLQSVFFVGMDGMDKMLHIMDVMRSKLPVVLDGHEVYCVLDQLNKKVIQPKTGEIISEYHGYTDNALIFYFDKEKTKRIVLRPSGTEPKIKIYAAVGRDVGLDKSWDEYAVIKKEVDIEIHDILEAMVSLAESISSGGQRFEILG